MPFLSLLEALAIMERLRRVPSATNQSASPMSCKSGIGLGSDASVTAIIHTRFLLASVPQDIMMIYGHRPTCKRVPKALAFTIRNGESMPGSTLTLTLVGNTPFKCL